MKDRILQTLEQIEKEEGVWEQNNSQPPGFVSPEGGLKTKFASIPRSTGKILEQMILERKPKTILEVGSSVGYSTLWLALGAEQVGGHVYATEMNPERIALNKKHIKEAGAESIVTLHEGDARETIKNWEYGKIDFVFLDAFKKDYSEFVDMLLPLMIVDGLIAIDNVGTHAKSLGPFLEKIRSSVHIRSEMINRDNGILLLFT